MLALLFNFWIPFQIIVCIYGYLYACHLDVILMCFCDNILNKKTQIQNTNTNTASLASLAYTSELACTR